MGTEQMSHPSWGIIRDVSLSWQQGGTGMAVPHPPAGCAGA